jgi:hypothetical protein
VSYRCVCQTPDWPKGSTFSGPQCSYCERVSHDDEWSPYGRKLAGALKRTTLELSHEQADALAELAATLTPSQRLLVMQTHSESGGTHVYASTPHDGDVHIARGGSITSLGGP